MTKTNYTLLSGGLIRKPVWRLVRTYPVNGYVYRHPSPGELQTVVWSGDFNFDYDVKILYKHKAYEYQRAGTRYQWLHLGAEQANG